MADKKKKELTPEEYRKQVEDKIGEVRKEWSIFFKTGIIMLAALLAVIIACIAWFVGNNKVSISGARIQSAGGEFDLAAAKGNKGAYDSLLEVQQPGTEVTVESETYLSTDNENSSITWALTQDSNMFNNNKNDGIEPGSSGKITFYIIPHKVGELSVTLDLTLTGYTVTGEKESASLPTEIQEADNIAQQLLEGHVLLFAGYNETSNSYQGWISKDAGPWKLSLDKDISLNRNTEGKLIWIAKNPVKDQVYPVTVYWIWPEILGSYLTKNHSNIGERPVLFQDDWNKDSENHLTELPSALYKTMCENSGTSNWYFYWKNDENFSNTVTEEKLSLMRTNFNPVIYGTLAVYYNQSDEYLGKHVRYVKLKLEAQ